MSRLVGYTRDLLLSGDGTTDAEQLTSVGVVRVFVDGAGDGRTRPGLAECLRFLEPGDTLMVVSATRLSHTVPHFLSTMGSLVSHGVGFRSLSEPVLSTVPGTQVDASEMYLALEGLRRRLVSVQTRTGMASAATQGRRPGRPTVMTPERVAIAVELRNVGRPTAHIARVLGVSVNAVQRALAAVPRDSESSR